jgi:acyl dehydratase
MLHPSPEAKKRLMDRIYFEDFRVGAVSTYGPRRVSREEIIAFASEFDPQPMHLDENAAKTTLLGGLGASGWHTCAVMMRLLCDGLMLNSSSQGSPGVDEVKWVKPVRPGDELSVRHIVLETRASKSRADVGIVRQKCEVLNQRDEIVMETEFAVMYGKRKPG